jgi:hypothetical protein
MDPIVFESAARKSGWMRAMADLIKEHPGWFRRAAKALAKAPERGYNSPRNNCSGIIGFLEGSSVERWRTPGHAFRAISSGICRAKGILKGFNIANIPWAVVMEELAAPRGPQRGGKIGRKLALKTLEYLTKVQVGNRAMEFVRFKGFRHDTWRAMTPEAQEFYRMKMREGLSFEKIILPPVREDDGVKMFVFSQNLVRQYQVIEGLIIQMSTSGDRTYFWGLRKQTLVIGSLGRSFHLPWLPSEISGEIMVAGNSWTQWGQGGQYCAGHLTVPADHESVGAKLSGSTRFWQRFVVRFAERAWKVQDSLAKAEGLELPP